MATRAGSSGTTPSSPGRTARGRSGAGAPRPTAAGSTDLAVLAEEQPWSDAELQEVRAELEADADRLASEVDEAEHDLVELMRDFGDGAGDDQADAGAATSERRMELSLANNARDLLEQTRHALERIDDGSYGVCEACGNAIGKMRLQAFPRATLCMTCKQKQERR